MKHRNSAYSLRFNDFVQSMRAGIRRVASSQVGLACITILLISSVCFVSHEVAKTQADTPTRLESMREQEQQDHELQQEIEQRWWAIEFYADTNFEPGDFPKEGYYTEAGTLWTPEVGGPCFDQTRRQILFKRKYVKLDPDFPPKDKNILIRF